MPIFPARRLVQIIQSIASFSILLNGNLEKHQSIRAASPPNSYYSCAWPMRRWRIGMKVFMQPPLLHNAERASDRSADDPAADANRLPGLAALSALLDSGRAPLREWHCTHPFFDLTAEIQPFAHGGPFAIQCGDEYLHHNQAQRI